MAPVNAPGYGAHKTFAKAVGDEPIPGYVLIEPLGRGGFGEVWKCEAPGGLHKAVKFVAGAAESVTGDGSQLRQEFEAFQQVKAIRHPFLLTLERVGLVGNELVMVMELADRQLGDRFNECRRQGLPGIPRDELLGYLREAAEALDVISAQYGLQHLDVKPANLFLTAGHVKVGDYGLVSKLDGGAKNNRGLTPRYAAPEVLCGEVHTQSDQYSLALVYHELLTGSFPYTGRTAQQLMLQHMSVAPDLRTLPDGDRAAVGTALAKKPDGRFASCQEFIKALITGICPGPQTPLPGENPSTALSSLSLPVAPQTRTMGESSEVTHANYPPGVNPRPGSQRRRRAVPGRRPDAPVPLYPGTGDTSLTAGFSMPLTRLETIHSILPAAWLQGQQAPPPMYSPEEAVQTVVDAADDGSGVQTALGAVTRLEDDTWSCRFLTSVDPRLAQVKLDLLWEQGGLTMDSRMPGRVVFRKFAPAPQVSGIFGSFSKKPKSPEGGYEVVVSLPEPGPGTGEVRVMGRLFGTPLPDFVHTAEREIVNLIDGIRQHLNTIPERRKHPRIPAEFTLVVYPLQSDGRVELPVAGKCKDVSLGGLAFATAAEIRTKYMYVAFEGVPAIAGLAILARTVRSEAREGEVTVSVRYRLDIGRSQPDA